MIACVCAHKHVFLSNVAIGQSKPTERSCQILDTFLFNAKLSLSVDAELFRIRAEEWGLTTVTCVRQRTWNCELPLAFSAVILQTTHGTTRAQDIQMRLTQRDGSVGQGRIQRPGRRHGGRTPEPGWFGTPKDDDAATRQFDAPVASVRPCAVSLTATAGEFSNCIKTGRPVLEVLRGKHPAIRDPDLTASNLGTFEP